MSSLQQTRLSHANTPTTIHHASRAAALEDQQEAWEAELDVIGAAASVEALQELLNRAPDPESGLALMVKGFIAGANKQRRSLVG